MTSLLVATTLKCCRYKIVANLKQHLIFLKKSNLQDVTAVGYQLKMSNGSTASCIGSQLYMSLVKLSQRTSY